MSSDTLDATTAPDRAEAIDRARAQLAGPEMTMLKAARELDDLCFRLSQVADLVGVMDDQLDSHSPGKPNDRSAALLRATGLMVGDVQRSLCGLTDRMLHAAQI